MRTANPYVSLALAWDRGWVQRQERRLASQIKPFKEWLPEHIRD
jgi:hypothetical protein